MGAVCTQSLWRTLSMVRASIVHVQDQRQRQTLRRQLGSLNLNLVKRITVARYAEHFNRFAQHLQDTNQPWPNSPEEFDLVVSEYLEILWDLGIPKTSATYTLASIHYYMPQLKRKLSRSWQLKAVWDKLELPCQAVPLDIDTLFAFVGYFWKIGQRAMSLACLVAFNGLLRTGELLELRISDCVEAPDSWVLQLRSTKAGQRRLLQDESVIIKDPLTMAALQSLSQGKTPGDFLVGISPHQFRRGWNQMKLFFGLSHLKYLPYSLRRGEPPGISVMLEVFRAQWCVADGNIWKPVNFMLLKPKLLWPIWPSLSLLNVPWPEVWHSYGPTY